MGRHRYRRAIAVMQDDVRRCSRRGEMGDRVEPVGSSILAGQYRNHAGHCARRRRIDAADQGMCVWRPQRGGIDLSGKIEIVTVTAATGEEAQVLLATYRVPDASLHGLMGQV